MSPAETLVQIDQIESVERLLAGLQQSAAQALQRDREHAGLSLREVAPHIGMTAATLHNLERGKHWRSAFARRVAEFYASRAV
jgi:ribosome-binding protein aMBF1 (putative translation factor)